MSLIDEIVKRGNIWQTVSRHAYTCSWRNIFTLDKVETTTAPHLLFVVEDPKRFGLEGSSLLPTSLDIETVEKWIAVNHSPFGSFHKTLYNLGWLRTRVGRKSAEFTTCTSTLIGAWRLGMIFESLRHYNDVPEVYIETDSFYEKFFWPQDRKKMIFWFAGLLPP